MLGLADIKDWLKQLDTITVFDISEKVVEEIQNIEIKQIFKEGYIVADHFYIGKLDNKQEKSIGIYQLNKNESPNIAIGGFSNTKTLKKNVSILIHWNKNAKETELKSLELYYKLLSLKSFKINNFKINYIELLVPEPVDVGTDDSNVYEKVIQATFYYEKEE